MKQNTSVTKRNAGHGGRRPGAGRPKSRGVLAAEKIEKSIEELKAVKAELGPDGEPPPQSAAELEALALATLRQIMKSSPQDGPRVSAAKAVREWAKEDRAIEAEAKGVTGKKAAAQAVAQERMAEGSKFSAPPPPPGSFQRMQ